MGRGPIVFEKPKSRWLTIQVVFENFVFNRDNDGLPRFRRIVGANFECFETGGLWEKRWHILVAALREVRPAE